MRLDSEYTEYMTCKLIGSHIFYAVTSCTLLLNTSAWKIRQTDNFCFHFGISVSVTQDQWINRNTGYISPCRFQGHFRAIQYTCLKMVCNSKTAGRKAKFGEIWDSGDTTNTYMRYLWPCSIQGHFGVIQCSCLKMACDSNMTDRRAKRSKLRDLWIVVTHTYIWGYILTF